MTLKRKKRSFKNIILRKLDDHIEGILYIFKSTIVLLLLLPMVLDICFNVKNPLADTYYAIGNKAMNIEFSMLKGRIENPYDKIDRDVPYDKNLLNARLLNGYNSKYYTALDTEKGYPKEVYPVVSNSFYWKHILFDVFLMIPLILIIIANLYSGNEHNDNIEEEY